MKVVRRVVNIPIKFIIQYLTSVLQKLKSFKDEDARGIFTDIIFMIPAVLMLISAIFSIIHLGNYIVDGGFTSQFEHADEYGSLDVIMHSAFPLSKGIMMKLATALAIPYIIEGITYIIGHKDEIKVKLLSLKVAAGICIISFTELFLRGRGVIHDDRISKYDDYIILIMVASMLALFILVGHAYKIYTMHLITTLVLIPGAVWCVENVVFAVSVILAVIILRAIVKWLLSPVHNNSKRGGGYYYAKKRRKEYDRMLAEERAQRRELEALVDDVLADEGFDGIDDLEL